jgi:hypothetical protein
VYSSPRAGQALMAAMPLRHVFARRFRQCPG